MPKRCDQGSSLLCSRCQKSGCWQPLGSVIYPAQGYYTYPLLSQPWLFQSTACEGFPWLYRQPNLLLKLRFSFHLLTVHLHPDDPQTPKPTCPKMDSSCVIPWTSLPAPHQKKKKKAQYSYFPPTSVTPVKSLTIHNFPSRKPQGHPPNLCQPYHLGSGITSYQFHLLSRNSMKISCFWLARAYWARFTGILGLRMHEYNHSLEDKESELLQRDLQIYLPWSHSFTDLHLYSL